MIPIFKQKIPNLKCWIDHNDKEVAKNSVYQDFAYVFTKKYSY